MRNSYEFPEVIQIAEAQSLILGCKVGGVFDVVTGDEFTQYIASCDIDE